MERDDLDDFIDEIANYIDKRQRGDYPINIENTKDRVRIALIRFLDGRSDPA